MFEKPTTTQEGKTRIDYAQLSIQVDQTETRVLSYPWIAINHPELGNTTPSKHKKVDSIPRNLTDFYADPKVQFRRVNHSPIPWGIGIVTEEGQYPEETLAERCRQQTKQDLLEYYLNQNLDTFEWGNIGTHLIAFPDTIDWGDIPEPIHALILDEEDNPDILFMSSEQQRALLRQISMTGYFDDRIVEEELFINPGSLGKLVESTNQTLAEYFGSETPPQIKGTFVAGYTPNGEYRYRSDYLKRWFDKHFPENLSTIAKKLDAEQDPDSFIYRLDEETLIEVFVVREDLLEIIDPGMRMRRQLPNLVLLRAFIDEQIQSFAFDTNDNTYKLLQAMKINDDGRLIFSRNHGRLSNNDFTNGKKGLARMFRHIGLDTSEIPEYILGDSAFPSINPTNRE